MNVGDSVKHSLREADEGNLDAAMLHACNAVDGTAKKACPEIRGSNARFTSFLRQNYGILGPMGAPGIDLRETRFPVKVERPKAADKGPDIADVIYGIHRCSHGHGEALPPGFELLPDAGGPVGKTHLVAEKGKVRLSDRIIYGLLATAVLSPANLDQRVPEGCFLKLGEQVLPINDWWGRAEDFLVRAALFPLPCVKLDFGDWMDGR